MSLNLPALIHISPSLNITSVLSLPCIAISSELGYEPGVFFTVKSGNSNLPPVITDRACVLGSFSNLLICEIKGPIQNLCEENSVYLIPFLCSYWNTKTISPNLGITFKNLGNNGTQ